MDSFKGIKYMTEIKEKLRQTAEANGKTFLADLIDECIKTIRSLGTLPEGEALQGDRKLLIENLEETITGSATIIFTKRGECSLDEQEIDRLLELTKEGDR